MQYREDIRLAPGISRFMPTPLSYRPIAYLMVGLLAWGLFHAVGAYRFNHNPWRSVVVLACSLAFLGFWAAMLASRKRRLDRQAAADKQ